MSPLTSSDRGLWYDPAQTGTGFELRVAEDGALQSEFFCGVVPGWFDHAVWFSIQGKPDADGRLPLLLTGGAVLGESHPLLIDAVGSVILDKRDDDTIDAVIEITGNGRPQFSPAPVAVHATMHLQRLVR